MSLFSPENSVLHFLNMKCYPILWDSFLKQNNKTQPPYNSQHREQFEEKTDLYWGDPCRQIK